VGVGGQLLEAVLIVFGLARLAEADLVRRHHAVAGFGQRVDRTLPGGATEVLAVQEDDGAAVRLGRLDVHVGHVQLRALRREAVLLDRIGVVEAFEFRAVGGFGCGCGGVRGAQGGAEQEPGEGGQSCWCRHDASLMGCDAWSLSDQPGSRRFRHCDWVAQYGSPPSRGRRICAGIASRACVNPARSRPPAPANLTAPCRLQPRRSCPNTRRARSGRR